MLKISKVNRLEVDLGFKASALHKRVIWMGIVESEVSSNDFRTSRNSKRIFESSFFLKWIPVLFRLNRKDDNLH